MTTVTVNEGDFAEAVQRAVRVAPTKGAAFDRAMGVVLRVGMDGDDLSVSATNMETTYYQRLAAEFEGDSATWRLPSQLLAGIAANFNIGKGPVKIFDKDGYIHFHQGRSKSKIKQVVLVDYPIELVAPFDTEDLKPVEAFPREVAAVAWACATDRAPLSGVHIDGHNLFATDSYVVTVAVCEAPVASPVTVPLGALVSLVKDAEDVRIGTSDNRLLLAMDDDVLASTVIYGQDYPEMRSFLRKDEDFAFKVTLTRADVLEGLRSLAGLASGERHPRLYVGLTKTQLKAKITVPELGESEATFKIANGPETPFIFVVDPKFLINGLAAVEDETLVLACGPDPDQMVKLEAEDGYECHIMVIRAADL